MPEVAVIDQRDAVAAVLPAVRQEILKRLRDEPDSATGLARKLGLKRQKVNYHVRALERAGFLELDSEQQRRGCTERRFRPAARAYIISPEVLGGAGDACDIRDRFSSAYLIAMAAQMVRDVARMRREADAAGRRLPTFALDVDVRFRSPAARTAFVEELTGAIARLAARYNDESPESRRYRFVIGGHPAPKGARHAKA